jgi:hypothetical protein
MIGKGAQVAGKVLSGMVFLPPWDPIVHNVTRLQANQLFMGLAILVAFVRQQHIQVLPWAAGQVLEL